MNRSVLHSVAIISNVSYQQNLREMKHILGLLLCLISFSSTQARSIQWELGEDIGVASLCRDRDAIMDLVRADQVNESTAVNVFASLASNGRCVVFDKHRDFTVVKTLHKYLNFAGRKSFVLEVVSNNVIGFRGFVMAEAPERPSI